MRSVKSHDRWQEAENTMTTETHDVTLPPHKECPFCGGTSCTLLGDTGEDNPVTALARMYADDDQKFDATVCCDTCSVSMQGRGATEIAAIINALTKWNKRA